MFFVNVRKQKFALKTFFFLRNTELTLTLNYKRNFVNKKKKIERFEALKRLILEC